MKRVQIPAIKGILHMLQGIGRLATSFILAIFLFGAASGIARAQDGAFWVQIEAHPSLAIAQERVRLYSGILPDVNGYSLRSGWYAIALGPYSQADAAEQVIVLRRQGLIPRDSYVEEPSIYAQQFWPIGSNNLATAFDGTSSPNATPPKETITGRVTVTPVTPIVPVIIEENLAEARLGEQQLDRAGREALQVALQWDGFYTSAIDGAFGSGTRRAMEIYQIAMGYQATGVLTSRQRFELMDNYGAELASLGMQRVEDRGAGVAIDLPLAMVQFDRYDYPFAHYDSRNNSGIEVLLISQAGTTATLRGLYEIMQTLEVVPLEGPRERSRDSFVLSGQNAQMRSHTVARLEDGEIKGFTLIWTPENDAQMGRVLPLMEASFSFLDGTLDPGAVDPNAQQNVDLVSGLEIRQADLTRSGFYVDASGAVLTTIEVVGSCNQLLIDDLYEADVGYRDDSLGLAILRPREALSPAAFAQFLPGPARLRSDIAVAGFPYGGALGTASLNYGILADLRGLNGEESLQRLELDITATEAGGPVLDTTGAVLGMVLPEPTVGRTLPPGVSFALRGDQMQSVLTVAGLNPTTSSRSDALPQEALARLGATMTVLVSCWN